LLKLLTLHRQRGFVHPRSLGEVALVAGDAAGEEEEDPRLRILAEPVVEDSLRFGRMQLLIRQPCTEDRVVLDEEDGSQRRAQGLGRVRRIQKL
jgi:hypothetical protein